MTDLEKFNEIFTANKKKVPNRKVMQSHVIATEALPSTLVEYVNYVLAKGKKNDTNTKQSRSKKTKNTATSGSSE